MPVLARYYISGIGQKFLTRAVIRIVHAFLPGQLNKMISTCVQIKMHYGIINIAQHMIDLIIKAFDQLLFLLHPFPGVDIAHRPHNAYRQSLFINSRCLH